MRRFAGCPAPCSRRSAPIPPLPSLTADDVGRDDGLSAFGVVEARKRRREGMPLGIFLGLVKFFRQAYLDLVRTAGLPREEEEGRLRYIERFFDRNEVAACVSWTSESVSERVAELQQKHDELSRVYRLVATAKKEWEGTIDRVDDMLFLADPGRRIRRCNRTFREFVGRSYAEILGRPFDRLLSEAGVDVELSFANRWNASTRGPENGSSSATIRSRRSPVPAPGRRSSRSTTRRRGKWPPRNSPGGISG